MFVYQVICRADDDGIVDKASLADTIQKGKIGLFAWDPIPRTCIPRFLVVHSTRYRKRDDRA